MSTRNLVAANRINYTSVIVREMSLGAPAVFAIRQIAALQLRITITFRPSLRNALERRALVAIFEHLDA